MKNLKYLLLFSLCSFIHQLNAQFSIGLKGGYTTSWEEYGDVGLPENAEIEVTGFNVAALVYFSINDFFSVGIEPGYVQRGAACVPGFNNGRLPIFEGDTKFFLHYIEAPLMVTVNLPLFKSGFGVYAKTGYGPSFLATAFREETDLRNDEPVIRERMDLKNNSNLNRWDHGVHGSLGLAYNFGVHRVFVEGDYFRGFKDAERFNESRNRSVSFNIGYLIGL